VAFLGVFVDEQGETAARFLLEAAGFFADRAVHLERVLTDRHNFDRQSQSFEEPELAKGRGAECGVGPSVLARERAPIHDGTCGRISDRERHSAHSAV
jgi:hypothetical protein